MSDTDSQDPLASAGASDREPFFASSGIDWGGGPDPDLVPVPRYEGWWWTLQPPGWPEDAPSVLPAGLFALLADFEARRRRGRGYPTRDAALAALSDARRARPSA